ncbi:MAG: hypothetical protein HUK40_10430 [Desulfobacter sp.]|nr:hypothetical protein [Desulfobacter sp.]
MVEIIAHRGARSLAPENTLADLEILDAGSHFEKNNPFSTVEAIDPKDLAAFKGESIPTLFEGLMLTRKLNWKVNLELKDHGNDPQLYYTASHTLAELARAGMDI